MSALSPAVRIPLALAILGLVAWLDYETGADISFSIFYLIPIAFMAWYGGPSQGPATAVAGALVWLAIDLLSRPDPHPVWAPYWNAAVRAGFFFITVALLARLRLTLSYMTRMALTDSLTGVLNGRAFEEASRRVFAAASRTGRPFSLLYLDVDDFKRVNDTLGHAGGDRLLKDIAALLQGAVRGSDLVARLGGDEFAVLLPEAGPEGAEALTERLCGAKDRALPSMAGTVTFSAGIVTFTRPPGDLNEAIRAADALMYRVKGSGKNACRQELYPPVAPPADGA